MDSPITPQGGRQREPSAVALRPINNLTEQMQGCTISKPKKREQTTATPASQARPRTQRRTGQENASADAAASTGSSADSGSVTPSRLNCISELQDELSCGICLEICVRPCATPCGHAFCRACLRLALQHKRQCPKCREVVAPSWQPKVNVALWNTIQLLFPEHAAAAPPPTPLAPPAAATAGAGSRTRAGGAQRPSQLDWLAASASSGVFAAHERAARQGFRPPRPAAASQADGRNTRAQRLQQQQQFVMPPDLQYLWQSMSRGAGSDSRRQSQLQPPAQQQPARSTRQRQGNPFANVAQRPHTLRGSASSSQRQEFIDLVLGNANEDILGQLNLLDSPPPAAARRGRGSSQLAASQGAAADAGRRRQRAAAAARVQAAVAAEVAGLEGGDEEDRDIAAAILASLEGHSNNSSSQHAAGAGTAAAAAVAAPQVRLARRRQQQQVQQLGDGVIRSDGYAVDADLELLLHDTNVLEDSDDGGYSPVSPMSPVSGSQGVSLFGRIHSGRSPQQRWAADEADDVVDELLTGSDSTDATGNQAGAGHTDSQAAPDASGVAVAAVRLSQGLVPQQQEQQVLDDVEDLLQVWSDVDEDGGQRVVSGLLQRPLHHGSAAGAAAAEAAAGPRRRRGHARVLEDDVAGEPAAAAARRASLGSDAGTAGGMAGQHAAAVPAAPAAAASAAPAAAAASVSELDADALSLSAPSPEPQPLMARLASFGAHYNRQHDRPALSQQESQQQQQQQQGHSSTMQSQMVEQALGVGPATAVRRLLCTTSSGGGLSTQLIDEALGVAGTAAAPTRGSSKGPSALAARANAAPAARPPRALLAAARALSAAAAAAGPSEDSEDDFMPSRNSRRGLTAVSASQQRQATSRPGSGRVVSGLRRCTRSSR